MLWFGGDGVIHLSRLRRACITLHVIIIVEHRCPTGEMRLRNLCAEYVTTVLHATFVVWIPATCPGLFHLFIGGLVVDDELAVIYCEVGHSHEHQDSVSTHHRRAPVVPKSIHDLIQVALLLGRFLRLEEKPGINPDQVGGENCNGE